MSAGLFDFVIEQGATFKRSLIYRDAAGVVVNLTGYTPRMQLRDKRNDGLLLEFTTDIVGAEGRINLSATDEQTLALSFDEGVYDVIITSAGGEVLRLLQGNCRLERARTRA